MQNIAGAVAVEIKIGMVCKVCNGVCVADGAIINMQAVFIIERERDGNLQPAGEALFAVGKNRGELHAVFAAAVAPELFIKARVTAVELVGAFIGGERVPYAVEHKCGVCNAVAVAADGRTKIPVVLFILSGGVIAEKHICGNAIGIGDDNGLDGCAIGKQRHAHMVGVFQCDGGNRALGAGRKLLNGQHEILYPFLKRNLRKKRRVAAATRLWKFCCTETAKALISWQRTSARRWQPR